jgi:hypothetical protein
MKNNRKRGKVFVADQVDSDVEVTFNELADAIFEDVQLKSNADADPFELYVHRIGSKIHFHPEIFRSRLIKGYQVLLEEIGHLEDIQAK